MVKNIQHSSNTSEWLTPVNILDKVKAVFGGVIDLDPCSNALAQTRVQATTYYTLADDGLQQDWAGNTFINPPRGRASKEFWRKLVSAPRVTSAIWLCFSIEQLQTLQAAVPGQSILAAHRTICIPRKRIAFDREDGSKGERPSHANAIVLVKSNAQSRAAFCAAFENMGGLINQ